MKDYVPLLQAFIVGFLALIGIILTQTWTTRREYAKRKIDLAEEVLALFYEVRDAIRAIRSPFSSGSEGSTRQRQEHETDAESRILDMAYVAIERHNKSHELFNALKSKRHRFMAMFRGKSQQPFDEIEAVLNRILLSAHMLGTHYWQRQGRVQMSSEEFQEHLEGMHEQEAIFWLMPNRDVISPMVDGAVSKVEAITDAAAREYANPFDTTAKLAHFFRILK